MELRSEVTDPENQELVQCIPDTVAGWVNI
jgi:hypothetical protein